VRTHARRSCSKHGGIDRLVGRVTAASQRFEPGAVEHLDVAAVARHVVACTRAGLQAGFHAIGDAAVQPWKKDRSVPGVAQGGIQAGRYAARTIRRRLSGEATPPFRYRNRGYVAVI